MDEICNFKKIILISVVLVYISVYNLFQYVEY